MELKEYIVTVYALATRRAYAIKAYSGAGATAEAIHRHNAQHPMNPARRTETKEARA